MEPMEPPTFCNHKRNGDTVATETPAPKRLNVSGDGNTTAEVSPDEPPSRQIPRTHQWEVGQLVLARMYCPNGPIEWKNGKVTSTIDNIIIEGEEYDYAIGISVEGDDGKWTPACTWHKDPHPVPKGKIGDYLRKRDGLLDSLPDKQKLQARLMRSNMSKTGLPNGNKHEETPAADDIEIPTLDSILLGDHGRKYHLSIKEQVLHLKKLPEVVGTIAMATNQEDPDLSVVNLLAYLVGQFSGLEISQLGSSRDESKYASSAIEIPTSPFTLAILNIDRSVLSL